MKQPSMIKCVALSPIKIGGAMYDRPPAGSEGRIASYAFRLPTPAAAALAKQGRLLPLHEDDAHTLSRETSLSIGAFVRGPTPKLGAPTPEPEPAIAQAEETPETPVELALRTKLKADLITALEASGLDPADYSTNGERVAALEALA